MLLIPALILTALVRQPSDSDALQASNPASARCRGGLGQSPRNASNLRCQLEGALYYSQIEDLLNRH